MAYVINGFKIWVDKLLTLSSKPSIWTGAKGNALCWELFTKPFGRVTIIWVCEGSMTWLKYLKIICNKTLTKYVWKMTFTNNKKLFNQFCSWM